jgi:NitT/TauT family transport system substrate-binding protein
MQHLTATIIIAAATFAAHVAVAADKLKIAVGQCGNWDSSQVELGIRTGVYAKYDLEIEALCTQGTGETQQAVIAGSADIGIGVGTLGAMAYSSNGASTHSVVLGLIKELGLKAKPIATGGPAATITLLMSGQVDIGWSSPPLAFDLLDEGKIRIFARANDVPSLRGQTVRVNIANADSLKTRRDAHVRFMRGFREVIDWMYADPKALDMYAAYRKTSVAYAKRLRDEFFAKSALDADTVKGLDQLMVEAVSFKYLPAPLTQAELAELVQVPLK